MNDLGRLFLSSYYGGEIREKVEMEEASQMLSGRIRILMQGMQAQEVWTDQEVR